MLLHFKIRSCLWIFDYFKETGCVCMFVYKQLYMKRKLCNGHPSLFCAWILIYFIVFISHCLYLCVSFLTEMWILPSGMTQMWNCLRFSVCNWHRRIFSWHFECGCWVTWLLIMSFMDKQVRQASVCITVIWRLQSNSYQKKIC